MATRRFRATVRLNGRTATGIEVPAEVVEGLGAGRRPKVRATVAGHTYRSSVASMGGTYMLPVSAEQRERAGIAAGDEVDVELEPDTAPREVTVPDDLAAALDPEARRFFDGLSYSNKRWYVLWIEGAKRAETRERRVRQAAVMLREGRERG